MFAKRLLKLGELNLECHELFLFIFLQICTSPYEILDSFLEMSLFDSNELSSFFRFGISFHPLPEWSVEGQTRPER